MKFSLTLLTCFYCYLNDQAYSYLIHFYKRFQINLTFPGPIVGLIKLRGEPGARNQEQGVKQQGGEVLPWWLGQPGDEFGISGRARGPCGGN